MYSEKSNSLLHDHILDGFHTTHEGLRKLKEDGLVDEREYVELLESNVKRLVSRIREFRLTEKLVCIFFALLFGYMQVNGEDLDMRRSSRVRTGRTARGARGRKGKDLDVEL
jgi:hypothetical protein